MLDLRQLHTHIQELDSGNEPSRRQALQSMRNHEAKEWADAPLKTVQALVESLQQHLQGDMKQTFLRQEVVNLLGKIGPRAEPAVPQLIDLLHEEVPRGVRAGPALALGKI